MIHIFNFRGSHSNKNHLSIKKYYFDPVSSDAKINVMIKLRSGNFL